MIDMTTRRGQIVAAALKLAAERPWREVSMLDIAAAAGLNLADVRQDFERKSQILSSFGYMVDAEVLKMAPRPGATQAKRDAVFEVVMTRFDALQPYKMALKSVAESGALDGTLLKSLMRSQAAMLQAAGIDTEGLRGQTRVAGLAAAFARTFSTWLEDDDPGQARTMALLDRQLRSGERTLSMFDDACEGVKRFAGGLRRGFSRQDGASSSASPPSPPDTPPAPTQP